MINIPAITDVSHYPPNIKISHIFGSKIHNFLASSPLSTSSSTLYSHLCLSLCFLVFYSEFSLGFWFSISWYFSSFSFSAPLKLNFLAFWSEQTISDKITHPQKMRDGFPNPHPHFVQLFARTSFCNQR